MPQLHNIRVNNVNYRVEVANTPHLHSLGLSFRTHLSSNSGMLFVFSDETNRIFHMRNMKFPLDIVFIGADKRVKWVIENAQPDNERLVSLRPSKYVLEVNAGDVKKNNIQLHSLIDMLDNPILKSDDQWMQKQVRKQEGDGGGFSGTAHTSEGTNTFTRTFGPSKDNKKSWTGKKPKNWAKILTSAPEHVSLSLLNEWLEKATSQKEKQELAMEAKRKGLIPQSGNWFSPGRWVVDPKIHTLEHDKPEDSEDWEDKWGRDKKYYGTGTRGLEESPSSRKRLDEGAVSYSKPSKVERRLREQILGEIFSETDGYRSIGWNEEGSLTVSEKKVFLEEVTSTLLKFVPSTHLRTVKSISIKEDLSGLFSDHDHAVAKMGGGFISVRDTKKWTDPSPSYGYSQMGQVVIHEIGHALHYAWFGKFKERLIEEIDILRNDPNTDAFDETLYQLDALHDDLSRWTPPKHKMKDFYLGEYHKEFVKEFHRAKRLNAGFTSEYSKTSLPEFFAENYSTYLQSPESLKQRNPSIYKLMNLILTSFDTDASITQDNVKEHLKPLKKHLEEDEQYLTIFDPAGVGDFEEGLPDLPEEEESVAILNEWLEKQDRDIPSEMRARGLEPKTGDWEHPYRWVRTIDSDNLSPSEKIESLINESPDLQHVLSSLSEVGQPYLVGGCVRDILLGKECKDFDIEMYGVPQDELGEIIQSRFGGSAEQVGKQFGVFKVGDFDISLPRTETKTGEKHTDFDVVSDHKLDPMTAAKRRDFTINALMYDVKEGTIVDFFGGEEDLANGLIKHIDDETFVEDPLRVYRAAQFSARFGFDIDPSTQELASQMDLSNLPIERVNEEFTKMLLKSANPSIGLDALNDMGVLKRYFPELAVLDDTPQRDDYHAEGDVFIHTKMVIDKASDVIKRFPSDKEKITVMLAALCHDLGKPSTTEHNSDGSVSQHGHEIAGIDPTREFLSKLTREVDLIDDVEFLVEHHLLPPNYYRSETSDATFRKIINRYGMRRLKLLSAVSEADILGRLNRADDGGTEEPDNDATEWFNLRLDEVAEKSNLTFEGTIRPLITGNELKDLGFEEGRELGDILRDIKSHQETGLIADSEEAIEYVKDNYISKSLTDLASWLIKAVSTEAVASAKKRGLVPKTGNWQKPGRWVRHEDVDVPVDDPVDEGEKPRKRAIIDEEAVWEEDAPRIYERKKGLDSSYADQSYSEEIFNPNLDRYQNEVSNNIFTKTMEIFENANFPTMKRLIDGKMVDKSPWQDNFNELKDKYPYLESVEKLRSIGANPIDPVTADTDSRLQYIESMESDLTNFQFIVANSLGSGKDREKTIRDLVEKTEIPSWQGRPSSELKETFSYMKTGEFNAPKDETDSRLRYSKTDTPEGLRDAISEYKEGLIKRSENLKKLVDKEHEVWKDYLIGDGSIRVYRGMDIHRNNADREARGEKAFELPEVGTKYKSKDDTLTSWSVSPTKASRFGNTVFARTIKAEDIVASFLSLNIGGIKNEGEIILQNLDGDDAVEVDVVRTVVQPPPKKPNKFDRYPSTREDSAPIYRQDTDEVLRDYPDLRDEQSLDTDNEDQELVQKAVSAESIASAKGRGLVPKTGNWQKPGRWVRPEDADLPVDEDEASLATQNVYTADEIESLVTPNIDVSDNFPITERGTKKLLREMYKRGGMVWSQQPDSRKQRDLESQLQDGERLYSRIKNAFFKTLDGVGKPNPFEKGERTLPKWQINRLAKVDFNWDEVWETSEKDSSKKHEVLGSVLVGSRYMNLNGLQSKLPKSFGGSDWGRKDPKTGEKPYRIPASEVEEEYDIAVMNTIIHELGHCVISDAVSGDIPYWFWSQVEANFTLAKEKEALIQTKRADASERLAVSNYSLHNSAEFFAECFKHYMTDTSAFKKTNPEMFKLMEILNKTSPDEMEVRPLNEEEIKADSNRREHTFYTSQSFLMYNHAVWALAMLNSAIEGEQNKIEDITAYWGGKKPRKGSDSEFDGAVDQLKNLNSYLPDKEFKFLQGKHILKSNIIKSIASGFTKEDIMEKVHGLKFPDRNNTRLQVGSESATSDLNVIDDINSFIDDEIKKYPNYGKEYPWTSISPSIAEKSKSLTKQEDSEEADFEAYVELYETPVLIKDTEEVSESITEESIKNVGKLNDKILEFSIEDDGFEPFAGTWEKIFVSGEPKFINERGEVKDFSDFEGRDIQKQDILPEFQKDSPSKQPTTKELSQGITHLEKQAPPGAPPRPGLEWKRSTRRWIRPESGSDIQVGISPTTGEGQELTRFFGEESREAKSYADSLINPEGREPTEKELNTAIKIYQELASVGGAHIEQALADAGFKDFTVKPNFGLFDSEYEPSLFVSGRISPDRKDEFTQLMVDIADTDFDQRSVIVHEPYEGDENVEFGVSDEATGESIEPAASLKFVKTLTAKEFNELGKKISEISDGTMGFASHPDGTGIDIINLSVYNTDYEGFLENLGRFLDDEDVERLSGGIEQHDGRAKKTRTIGKQSGPAGFYSEGHYEQRDSYDGLITYDDYRSYHGSKKQTEQELRKQLIANTCSQCSSNCSCVLPDHTCECYHDCTCPDNSLGGDAVDIIIDIDSLSSLLNLSKAVVTTPMSGEGKFNAKGVETGDSVWITVNDPESPLRGRPILITKRPDGLFALTGGGGQSEDTEARKHIVLTGTPKESKRDKELKSQISEAEEVNSEVIAEKKEIEQEARDRLKSAADAMTEALGIKKADAKELLDKKDEVQRHVESVLGEESSSEAKRITDTIMKQANQANRKISTGVQRERQAVLVKIGRKIRSMKESEGREEEEGGTTIIPDTVIPQGTTIEDVIESDSINVEVLDEINDALPKFEPVSIPLLDISTLVGLTPAKQESAIANHFDKQVEEFFEGKDEELAGLEEEDKVPEKEEEEETVTIDLGKAVAEPLELKSQEQLEEAIEKTRDYFEKKKEVQLQADQLKKVPLAVVTPSTLSTLRDSIEAVDVSIDDDELEKLTKDNFDGWNRNNQALAFYDAVGEFWNDDTSLTEEISGAGSKVQSTMKFHMDSGAATALAVLAKEHLGLKIDTRKLMEKGNIELAAASVAWAMRDKYKNDASKLDEIIDSIRTANSSNLSETEKRALERHSNLSKQMDEIQKQKDTGELLDKVKISELERNNLIEQRINLGVSLGSMQASSTLFDQLVKVRTAKDNVLTLNAGEHKRDAETVAMNLKLKEGSYDIQPTEEGTWNVVLSSDGLEKHTSQEKDLQAKHDNYDKIKTDDTGLSEDDDGNVIVEDYEVPFWNDRFVPEGEEDSSKKIDYKWRAEQRNDINWLLATTEKSDDNPTGEGGGLITRTVGAGKTNTALGFFAHKMKENPDYKSIVAVPKGRAQQWYDEANRFMTLPEGMSVQLIPEGASKSDVDDILLNSAKGTLFITGHRELSRSHEMLNQIQTNAELGEDIGKFGGICIDEPQELQARGQSGNMGALGRRLMKLPIDHRVGLTATPAKRSPLEVYDLIKWSSGAKDIGAKTTFQRTFSGFGSGTNAQDTAIRKVFYETISPYISGDRITQPDFKVNSDIIDVNRTDSQVENQISIEAKREETVSNRQKELIAEAQGNPNHRLRRGANWEATLSRRAKGEARKEVELQHQENMDGGDWQNNGRLVALREQLGGASDKKHVVYIDSKTQRNSLTAMLKDMGYTQNQIKNIASTTTSISGKEMAERVKAFRKGDVPIIMIDSKSASGYNLQNGDQLHVIGTPPEAANYVQAQGRIARMPRKGDVDIKTYRYGDSPTEQAHWNDLDAQIKLLRATAPGLFRGQYEEGL